MSTSSHHHLLPSTKKWRFTYESNSHIPILRLYIFNTNINPSSQCTNLNATILSHKSLLQLTWLHNDQTTSLWVPIPRVLIDPDSPINLRALGDHIEVKFVLLLPVDHPIVSNFDFQDNVAVNDEFQPLRLDSGGARTIRATNVTFRNDPPKDESHNFGHTTRTIHAVYSLCYDNLNKLTSSGEVHFYCRGCSTKLTRAVRYFKEMPSVNWREAADNWFGTCCCSFGGVSEKLVAKYADSYTCTSGMCLLDATSVVLCKDDFIGYKFPDNIKVHKSKEFIGVDSLEKFENLTINHGNENECCHVHADEEQTPYTSELLSNKASLLNGLLGNCFMVTSPYLSKDIKWSEISCPNCSCLLGAYPHDNIDDPLNGSPLNDGIHLFKCFISTCLPVGGPTDLFKNYTLERMFTSQLLETAKDELSFRTVVRNLQTRSPMLQIVLLNPNSWCSFGDCIDEMISVPNIFMYPMIKVLFSDCSDNTEFQSRKLDEWVSKNQVDDVYMLTSKALAESLELANSMLPSSHARLQGLSLSFLRR